MVDGRCQLFRTNRVVGRILTVFIGLTIHASALDACSGDNRREALRPVLTSGRILFHQVRCATEFASYNDKCVVQHAAFHEISKQPGQGLIETRQTIETPACRRYQLVARRKDGSTFPILLNNSTHRNEKGEVTGAFGFVTDLTPILEAQRAVAESERDLRGILDDLQDTYYRTDSQGIVTRASRSGKQLLGYDAEEYVGRPRAAP